MRFLSSNLFTTYSIVARDPETGDFGVAVQTHQMGVGRVVPWLRPGHGAIATQSLVNISFGPMALAMLAERIPAPKILDALIASDPDADRRQVAVIDANGLAAAWTGERCIAEAGHLVGKNYSVQANMMTRSTVITAMSQAFEQAGGELAQRMMAALQAAQDEDGDIRGKQSAALRIVSGDSQKRAWESLYDLRVDEHAEPVIELNRLVRLHRADHISDEGYRLLRDGERTQALSHWAAARELAPELEELAFWQAITLVDEHADVLTAIEILRPVLENESRREHWIDLIQRLVDCELITQTQAASELIQELT